MKDSSCLTSDNCEQSALKTLSRGTDFHAWKRMEIDGFVKIEKRSKAKNLTIPSLYVKGTVSLDFWELVFSSKSSSWSCSRCTGTILIFSEYLRRYLNCFRGVRYTTESIKRRPLQIFIMLCDEGVHLWLVFWRIVPFRAVADFLCLAMASLVNLTPQNRHFVVYLTPPNRHFTV